ncbi:MAG: ABC transporter ATP-binding protein [Novosphingobium sp.]
MSPPALSVREVSRFYGGRAAVADASLDLRAGRITCLLGPSGCGKSTLLRLMAGLEPIDAGEIAIDGKVVSTPTGIVPPEDRGIGLVFQDFALFPHLNVTDNIGFGLKAVSAESRRQQVAALLTRFQLEHLAGSWPHMLSGGEQQRVAIARALARAPAALLLDEPFSGLDGHLRSAVRQSVLADLRAAAAAVLIVTHDPEEAMLIADDLLLMAQGRILQAGSPEDCYLRPASIAAARLLGEASVLPARIEGGAAHTPFGIVPARGLPDGQASAMVRPEAVRIAENGASAMVCDVRFGGAFHLVTFLSEGTALTARTTGSPPPTGALVKVALDPARTVIYADALAGRQSHEPIRHFESESQA